jgi:zinc/manganese transport system substrate-binding protein
MLRLLTLCMCLSLLSGTPANAAEPVPIVASFSILGDLVHQIGGDRVSVDTLVGPEEDAHVFDPAPRDAARLAAAKLVVINGLGFEGWIDRLIKASGGVPRLVIASVGVSSHRALIDGREMTDPHAWQDVSNVRIYARNIADALISIDPEGGNVYRANLTRFDADLAALDNEIHSAISAIPPERRKIVTTHDAFGYFALAYGVEMIAPQGVSTEAEASAKDVARIIRQVKSEKIPAVFLENISDPRLAARIAAESGARIGGKLYSDALSKENASAGTYIAMMKANIRELTKALMP